MRSLFLVALLSIFGLIFAACSPQQGGVEKTDSKFTSTDISGADFAKELKLTDHNGKLRTMSDFKGKAVVLFFGYTHCPDVYGRLLGYGF